MITHGPAALDSATLARRLRDLAGDERHVQVDFLLHLDELDRRQAFLDLGFGSLWDYCLGELHLREGAAGRRIGAMRVLRRFPALEAPLRDGRLCLSTAALLGQVLTVGNLDDLVGRAAFKTKAEVEDLVVSIRPRPAPRDGIRRISEGAPAVGVPSAMTETRATASMLSAMSVAAGMDGAACGLGAFAANAMDAPPVPTTVAAPSAAAPPRIEGRRAPELPAEVDAVARDRWSLRVTLDPSLREDLETLKALLSHKLPGGDLAEVLREAVRCGIEKHGKRRGAVAPSRERSDPPRAEASPRTPRAIPAAVRRQVWSRDGGRCTFEAADGRRCESRWQLELDHVDPAARGGAPSAENLRLRCRRHNFRHAEETYGREHMARFRRDSRDPPRTGKSTVAGDSG